MKRDKQPLTSIAPTTANDPCDPALRRQIAERAYQLYEMRGGAHGGDVDDWLKAEDEIMARFRRRSATGPKSATVGRSRTRTKTPKVA
jgi:hypothetical protein